MTARRVVVVVLAVPVLALGACSGDPSESVLAQIENSDGSLARFRSYSDIFGALPDPAVPADRFATSDRSQLVVTGTIRDVVAGVGASWVQGDDGAARVLHEYGSEDSTM